MSKKGLRLAKSFIKAQGGIVNSEPGPYHKEVLRRTTLEWHANTDQPKPYARCLIMMDGALQIASYDATRPSRFIDDDGWEIDPSNVDAWAYAPKADEVLE
jgi:hypothetical protein